MRKISIAVLALAMLALAGGAALADHYGMAVLAGTVVETMDSGGYTYVQLENEGQKFWVACPKIKVEVGQHLEFSPGTAMKDFESKTLNRTFDKVYFTTGLKE